MEKYFKTKEKEYEGKKFGSIFIPSLKSLKETEGVDVYFGAYGKPDEVIIHHHYRTGTMGKRNDPATFEKLKSALNKILNDPDDRSWADDKRWAEHRSW